MIRALIEMGNGAELDVSYSEDTDTESKFRAVCNETGEKLVITGWLISNIEVIEQCIN